MSSREERLQKQNQLRQLREEVEQELKQLPGVVGVGIGFKMTGGEVIEEIVFQVYVDEKKPPEAIPPEQMIPAEIRGIPTDVLTVPRGTTQADPTPGELQKKHRPLVGGIQIKNTKSITSTTGTTTTIQTAFGTLGCFARLTGDNTGTYILSNEHVMLALGGSVGEKIAQADYTDCICCDFGDVGRITAAVNDNLVDCAIAKLDSDIAIKNEIMGIGTIQGSAGIATVAPGDTVRKVGRTTALTTGTIFSVSSPIIVDGKPYNNQILVTPSSGKFSDHGDSGSAVLDDDNKVIGLLKGVQAVSPFLTFVNPIEAVTSALNITIIAGSVSGGGGSALVTRGSETVPVRRPSDDHPLRVFEAQLEQSDTGRKVLSVVRQHFDEVSMLVNQRRPVTVVWRRKQGPAFLAALMRQAKNPGYEIPAEIEGVSRQNMLMSMVAVLDDHGSPALKRDLHRYGLALIAAVSETHNLDTLLARLGDSLAPTEADLEPQQLAEG